MSGKSYPIYSISLPVVTVSRETDGKLELRGEVLGTCFSLSNNLMITAGHVIKTVRESEHNGMVAMLNSESNRFLIAPIAEAEMLSCDLAIFALDLPSRDTTDLFSTLPWRKEPITTFDEVRALGYAYGLSIIEDRKSIIQRGFQGYVIADPKEFVIHGSDAKPFAVYELSFPAPRGLSGAPLLTATGLFGIAGVIIGNSKSRMLILESEEVEERTSTKTIWQQYESLSFGIAVHTNEILSIKSEILKCTVEEYLEKNKLLI